MLISRLIGEKRRWRQYTAVPELPGTRRGRGAILADLTDLFEQSAAKTIQTAGKGG